MTAISIVFSRFSAFYSPLIATFSGPFLAEEGLDASYRTLPAGLTAAQLLTEGAASVAQSAVSQGFMTLERGETPATRHFAQINRKDGFFLAGREAEPDFAWPRLAGRQILVDHGGQPLAMFRYGCHRAGVAYDAIDAIDAGSPDDMVRSFLAGNGDYIHLQGPAPQQLAADGAGHIVAAVGDAVGECAFSSLAAAPEWLASAEAAAFMRAYQRARAFMVEAPEDEAAAAVAPCFAGRERGVLLETIRAYRALGCWGGGVEITRAAYDAAQEVFRHSGLVTRRHNYTAVCVAPPS